MNAVGFFRVSLQENVDMIKLQRLVKEKSARISELDEKFKALEEVTISFFVYKTNNLLELKSVYFKPKMN